MHFEPNQLYHVYNRGNNKIPIFFNEKNYFFFLNKVRSEWLKFCEIFCYCLMPNHFHFMLLAKPEGCDLLFRNGKICDLQNLSKAIGKTLSSYTQAINIQNNTTGNLFQKKTKAKCLTEIPIDAIDFAPPEYLVNCFHYVHDNPHKSGLVKNLPDWPHSSWPDYYGYRNDDLCSKEKAIKILGLPAIDGNLSGNFIFNEAILEGIW